MDFSTLSSSRDHEMIPKNDLSSRMQCSIEKRTVTIEMRRTKKKDNVVQTTVYPSLKEVEMTMRAPILIQQFTHLVYIPIALASLSENYPRLSYLLFEQDRTNTTRESRQTQEKRANSIRDRRSSRHKSKGFTVDLRGEIACFAW